MPKRDKKPKPSKAVARSTPSSWHERLRSIPLLCLLLAFVTFAVFVPAVRNDFVNYDDSDYVTANPHIQGGLKWENIEWAFITGHASNWHPLTWLSHMLDCQLFGQNPAMHHLVSVLLHITNTILLLLLLNQITGAVWRSAIVAALFALHPLHVESVAWASERKDVLSAFFFFLTLMAYSRSRRGDKADSASRSAPLLRRLQVGWYLLALLLFALGLMSKPMLVTLPFVLLLLDFWPLRRFGIKAAEDSRTPKPRGESSARDNTPTSWSAAVLCRFQSLLAGQAETASWSPLQLIAEKIPFFLLSIASSIITFKVQQEGGAVSTSISPGARIANAIVSYVHYILDMFWPTHLSVLYPHPGTWPVLQVVASAALLVVITAAVLISARKYPYLPLGWFWFLGMLVPAIGLIQVGVQSRADRYTYLPLIGLFVMLAWGIAELLEHFSRTEAAEGSSSLSPRERAGVRGKEASASRDLSDSPQLFFTTGFTLFCLAACAILTSRQIGYWRNSETLFGRAVQVTKNNYLAYNNLGFYLSNRGDTLGAMENYRKALEINPNYEDAHNNLGYAYANLKKYPEAIAEYEKALKIRPNHIEVNNNLGNALADVGRVDEAIEHYMITLRQKPDHADAHNGLAIALSMKGRFDEAIEHFHAALRYKPNDAGAHSNLGNTYGMQGKFDLAIAEYKEALRLNPKDSQAENNLGITLCKQGKLDEAISHYQTAMALKPDDPQIHYNLGVAFAQQGKREEALAQYNAALRLKPDYAEAQTQLRALSAAPAQ